MATKNANKNKKDRITSIRDAVFFLFLISELGIVDIDRDAELDLLVHFFTDDYFLSGSSI